MKLKTQRNKKRRHGRGWFNFLIAGWWCTGYHCDELQLDDRIMPKMRRKTYPTWILEQCPSISTKPSNSKLVHPQDRSRENCFHNGQPALDASPLAAPHQEGLVTVSDWRAEVKAPIKMDRWDQRRWRDPSRNGKWLNRCWHCMGGVRGRRRLRGQRPSFLYPNNSGNDERQLSELTNDRVNWSEWTDNRVNERQLMESTDSLSLWSKSLSHCWDKVSPLWLSIDDMSDEVWLYITLRTKTRRDTGSSYVKSTSSTNFLTCEFHFSSCKKSTWGNWSIHIGPCIT